MAVFMHRVLQLIPPETAHNIGLRFLKTLPFKINVKNSSFSVKTRFGVIDNPIGLAAGFDKNAAYLSHLSKLGFGYIVAGTVTRMPRAGMPKPRIVRHPREKALVNAMGFPNKGLEKFMENMSKHRASCPVLASIADEDLDRLVECYVAVQKKAAAVEVNISSPNTPELRKYFQPAFFRDVAASLYSAKHKPTYLKIPPVSKSEAELIARIVGIWLDQGFDGVTAVNALLVDEAGVSAGRGGLSGRPIFPYMLECVKLLRKFFGEEFELNAVGGIFTGQDIFTAIENGADTVQIYTAVTYRGLYTVKQMLAELRTVMEAKGFKKLDEIRARK
jgi:dihydroorotate dehydrogenase